MKVDKSPLEGSKIKIHVEATAQEFADAAQKGVQTYLLNMSGETAEGRAMDDILRDMMGADGPVDAAKVDLAVNYLLPRAVAQLGVVPVCTPSYDTPDMPKQDAPLIFDIVTLPKPQMELNDYGPVDVTVDSPNVTDAEIDEQIKSIAESAAVRDTDPKTGAPRTVVPEIDDAWVKSNINDPKVTTLAQLRDALRESGIAYKNSRFEEEKLDKAAEGMAARLSGDVPDDMVTGMRDSMIDELGARLDADGMTIDSLLKQRGMTIEELRADAEAQARTMLRQGFALDAVFRHENLSIDDSDIADALHAIAPGDEEAARKSMVESGYMFTVEETAERMKAGQWILDHANVTVR